MNHDEKMSDAWAWWFHYIEVPLSVLAERHFSTGCIVLNWLAHCVGNWLYRSRIGPIPWRHYFWREAIKHGRWRGEPPYSRALIDAAVLFPAAAAVAESRLPRRETGGGDAS